MKTQPRYRRPLNPKQLDILHLLYRFRFATTELIAKAIDANDKNKVNRRLKILFDQEYIARKYEPSYRLRAQHASYCMLPKGIRALKELPDNSYDRNALKSMYKDRSASDRFIRHWLDVFDIYCQIRGTYGKQVRFFTKTELIRYEYFPLPLPDSYVRVGIHGVEQHVFIDLCESTKPFFASMTRLNQYKEYSEEGEWESATSTKMPRVFMVCDTAGLKRKLIRYAEQELDDTDDDDLSLTVVTKDEVTQYLDPNKKARER